MKTYTLEYRYAGDRNFFKTIIPAESDEEAIFDAENYINGENAQVAGKPKEGNFIELGFVYHNGKLIEVLHF